jgi:hypothetical protein
MKKFLMGVVCFFLVLFVFPFDAVGQDQKQEETGYKFKHGVVYVDWFGLGKGDINFIYNVTPKDFTTSYPKNLKLMDGFDTLINPFRMEITYEYEPHRSSLERNALPAILCLTVDKKDIPRKIRKKIEQAEKEFEEQKKQQDQPEQETKPIYVLKYLRPVLFAYSDEQPFDLLVKLASTIKPSEIQIKYLAALAGKPYKPKSLASLLHIEGSLDEGFTFAVPLAVVDGEVYHALNSAWVVSDGADDGKFVLQGYIGILKE